MNWGAQSADGSWNGMIKELLLEEHDMGDFIEQSFLHQEFEFSK